MNACLGGGDGSWSNEAVRKGVRKGVRKDERKHVFKGGAPPAAELLVSRRVTEAKVLPCDASS